MWYYFTVQPAGTMSLKPLFGIISPLNSTNDGRHMGEMALHGCLRKETWWLSAEGVSTKPFSRDYHTHISHTWKKASKTPTGTPRRFVPPWAGSEDDNAPGKREGWRRFDGCDVPGMERNGAGREINYLQGTVASCPSPSARGRN